jgi:cell division protein FtsL
MVRVLNFFCFALAALSCLALYRVSEQTRVANAELVRVERHIAAERSAMHVLEANWQSVAAPERIQRLAQSKLGISDTATVQLSSFELLPRRGENEIDAAGTAPIAQASVQLPVEQAPPPHPGM